MILSVPSRSNRRFSGLMSRWTSPAPWAWERAPSASRRSRRVLSRESGPSRSDQLGQVGSRDVLHRVPDQTAPSSDVVDVDQVGMIEPRCELGLPAEPLDHGGVLNQGGMQHLERDQSFQVQVPHPVHPSEAARLPARRAARSRRPGRGGAASPIAVPARRPVPPPGPTRRSRAPPCWRSLPPRMRSPPAFRWR